MKSQFVNLTNRSSSYDWITNKHFKKHVFEGKGLVFFIYFGGGSKEDDQDEKLLANLSTTGKKEEKTHTKPRNKWITGEKRILPSFIIFS